MDASQLAVWFQNQFGRNARFKSPRQLSLAAGLNQNAVASIIERGRAEPETLIALAGVLNVQVEELFRLAGWLPPRAAKRRRPLTPYLEDLCDAAERLDPPQQRMLLAAAQAGAGMLESQAPDLPVLRRVGEVAQEYVAE